MSECQSCPAGYYCESEGQTQPTSPCLPGYYCPVGTANKYAYPCPVGFYRNASAAISSMDCSICFSGMYCDKEGLAFPKSCPQVC